MDKAIAEEKTVSKEFGGANEDTYLAQLELNHVIEAHAYQQMF